MKDKLFEIGYSVFLGLLWWLITMLYHNIQWKQFSLKIWIMNLVLAWLTAWVIWEFLPHSIAFRDGILWISGVVSFRIIEFIQINWLKIIGKATGLDKMSEWKDIMKQEEEKEKVKEEEKPELPSQDL